MDDPGPVWRVTPLLLKLKGEAWVVYYCRKCQAKHIAGEQA